MNGGGCDQYDDCEVQNLWICPLLEEGVSVKASTYRSEWLICEIRDGKQGCPTSGYHRECVELSDVIGYRCR